MLEYFFIIFSLPPKKVQWKAKARPVWQHAPFSVTPSPAVTVAPL